MSVLKEKAQVIMLPTKNKSNLILNESLNILGNNNDFSEVAVELNSYINYYNLYIVSDEEIKVGDWFLCGSEVHKCTGNYSLKVSSYVKCKKGDCSVEICKKIIATTDTSISKPEKGYNWDRVVYPQPSQGFIEKYIKEYNKGNIITDILVEYEEYGAWVNRGQDFECTSIKPKILPNNIITIHPIKNSWTKEEVEHLLFKYAEEEHAWFSNKSETDSFNKWIKENL